MSMKFVVYVKNLMLNEKRMVCLIHNICKIIYSKFLISKKKHYLLFRALKNQMTLIQTLSDNHQTKLNNNEQQIEQVKSFIFSFFVFYEILVLVSNRN